VSPDTERIPHYERVSLRINSSLQQPTEKLIGEAKTDGMSIVETDGVRGSSAKTGRRIMLRRQLLTR
jgi:hypothetical protein